MYSMLDGILKGYIEQGYSLALIGCRARGTPFDVCEYNILAYSKDLRDSTNNILYNAQLPIKVHMLSNSDSIVKKAMLMNGMKIIHDPNMQLSTLAKVLPYNNAITYYIRDRLVESLLYLSKTVNFNDMLASLWLRIATTYYIEACIAMHGMIIMPAHMLKQLRSCSSKDFNIIVEASGVEHSSRSLLSIMSQGFIEMLRNNSLYDAIVESKVNHMYVNGMYTDLYMYIIYLCRDVMNVIDDITILGKIMHLSGDAVNVKNIAYSLIDLCKERLKAIVK